MPRNSKSQVPAARVMLGMTQGPAKAIRIGLGILVGLNLIAAGLLLFPPGGSADSLERDLAALQSQVQQQRATLTQTRQHLADVERARAAGDAFLSDYFLKRRTSSSEIVKNLVEASSKAQIKQREYATSSELIDGSDTLSLMSITANFEGTYKSLMNFVREIDLSPNLLIIESLNAAPIQGSNNLAVSMKLDAFVRDEPEPQAGLVASNATNGDGR